MKNELRKIFCLAFFTFHFSLFTALAQAPDFDSLFRSQPAFGEHWDTDNLFAYRSAGGEVPPEVTLTLTDSLGRGFCAPAVGRIYSRFGIRGRRPHRGTDIRVALGQPIFAAWDGVVRYSGWNSGGFGHIVIIRHASGLESYYAHLSKRSVEVGQRVEAGETIGLGGRTGRASALHLHFEVRWHDRSFDPERLIDFETGALLASTFVLRREYFDTHSRMVDEAAAERKDTVKLIPRGGAAAPSQADAAVYHTIKSGDTLWSLARRNGTTVAALCALNGIAPSTKLRLGMKLKVKSEK